LHKQKLIEYIEIVFLTSVLLQQHTCNLN